MGSRTWGVRSVGGTGGTRGEQWRAVRGRPCGARADRQVRRLPAAPRRRRRDPQSLGRLGVPMYAVTEDRFTPAASSRYLQAGLRLADHRHGESGAAGGGTAARRAGIGRPAVLLPHGRGGGRPDRRARRQRSPEGCFLFPRVEPGLPRRLASKQGLHELCVEHGVPTPAAAFPGRTTTSWRSPRRPASRWWPRTGRRSCGAAGPRWTARRGSRAAGAAGAGGRDWGARPGVILQEYLPREDAEDWIVHAYFDRRRTRWPCSPESRCAPGRRTRA